MKNSTLYTLIVAGSAAFLLSCLKEKSGIVDFPQNTPRLLTASIQPSAVNLDLDTVNVVRLVNGDFQITASAYVKAVDADGAQDIPNVSFTVYKPGSGETVANGTMVQSSSAGDTATYSSPLVFVTKRTDVGLFQIEVSVRDNAGFVSNVQRLPMNVMRNNSKPVISNLSAPDTLRIPVSGVRLFLIAVSASDSDGLGDIAEVYFKSINSSNPNFRFSLFDDGAITTHGDTVAGDGRFSGVFRIDSSNTPGTKEFRFWARDNTGALSDSLIHFITVIP